MKKILLWILIVIAGLIVIPVAYFSIRQAIVNARIERDWRTAPAALPKLLTTSKLEILPLYEVNSADPDLQTGHGVSYLVSTDSATVLLDLGDSPDESALLPSLQNLQALGISPDEIDAMVFSHPHWDHFGGMTAWQTKTIPFDQLAGHLRSVPIFVPVEMQIEGASLTHSAQPTLIAVDAATTGVIPYSEIFPLNVVDPAGYEQGLIVDVAGKGPVLITGCGHPGLERLVTRVEMLLGKPIVGVVGGLHYGAATAAQLQPHIDFFKARSPQLVALSPHDTSAAALGIIQAAFPDAFQAVVVGQAIQFGR